MTGKRKHVPELSLGAFAHGGADKRRAFTDGLIEGLHNFGFVILKDHGVDRDLLARAYRLSSEFFALPVDEKMKYHRQDGQRGYTPFGREHAKNSSFPDLKEFWHIGREFAPDSPLAALYPPNFWPERPVGFYATFTALYDALEAAGLMMLDALAPALGVADNYFRKMATGGNSVLRLLHYPPIPADADPRSIRAAPHEDINLITILVAADKSGLELLDRDGKWLPVETDSENLIVDAGDMLARITNDVIPATTHRVVNPAGANESRYSMPFFMHPRADARLTCIDSCRGEGAKYPDITADEFLKERLAEIGLTG